MGNKEFITEYLRALSGKPKPVEKVRAYVADERLVQHILDVEAAFPRYAIEIEDLLAEGEKVAVRGTFHGVQRGPFAGIDATGEPVSVHMIVIYRVESNVIVDHWLQFDLFGLIQQLRGEVKSAAA